MAHDPKSDLMVKDFSSCLVRNWDIHVEANQ